MKEVFIETNIYLLLCRGQSYNNAANMSKKYKCVKSKILHKNPIALFFPCSTHSLNLCGTHTKESSPEIKSVFGNIQKLYNIFSCRLARWKILKETPLCVFNKMNGKNRYNLTSDKKTTMEL